MQSARQAPSYWQADRTATHASVISMLCIASTATALECLGPFIIGFVKSTTLPSHTTVPSWRVIMTEQELESTPGPRGRGVVGGLATSVRLSSVRARCCSCFTSAEVAGDAGGEGARRDPTLDCEWPTFGSLPDPALPGTGNLPLAIIRRAACSPRASETRDGRKHSWPLSARFSRRVRWIESTLLCIDGRHTARPLPLQEQDNKPPLNSTCCSFVFCVSSSPRPDWPGTALSAPDWPAGRPCHLSTSKLSTSAQS